MRLLAGTFGLALSAATALTSVSAASTMRVSLNASVATGCAIAQINADDWASGMLRMETRCNAEHFSLRLQAGSEAFPLDEVSANGAATVRVRDGQIWVTQARPGTLTIDIQVDDPSALAADSVSVRIDAL